MEKWKDIYNLCKNAWKGGLPETICGSGSTIRNSSIIIEGLNKMINNYDIKSIADLGCGDFNWMKKVNLSSIDYIGYDWFIKNNADIYGSENITFAEGNIADIDIRKSDLVICKDVMIHMDNDHALAILNNIKRSKPKYLFVTTFNICSNDKRDLNSNFAPLNIELKPFYIMGLLYRISLAMPDYPPNDEKYFNFYRLNDRDI